MQGLVKMWGNNAAVRIPASVLEAARVRLDQPVEIREENGRIVIEPLRPARYDLAALVAGITDENRHEPVEAGRPVGQEVWCRRRPTFRTPATLCGCSSTREPGTSKPGIGRRSS